MPRERTGYRENLQDILDFFSGKRLLTVTDVKTYTGLSDNRTVKRRFPFTDNCITAATLALYLVGGGQK